MQHPNQDTYNLHNLLYHDNNKSTIIVQYNYWHLLELHQSLHALQAMRSAN